MRIFPFLVKLYSIERFTNWQLMQLADFKLTYTNDIAVYTTFSITKVILRNQSRFNDLIVCIK